MTEQNFRIIMEFQYYINLLTPEERRVASTLEFKLGDSLLDFASRIANKMKAQPPPVIAATNDNSASLSQSPVLPQPASNVPQSPVQHDTLFVCTYCSKPGHGYKRCYLRQRHERQAARVSQPQMQ